MKQIEAKRNRDLTRGCSIFNMWNCASSKPKRGATPSGTVDLTKPPDYGDISRRRGTSAEGLKRAKTLPSNIQVSRSVSRLSLAAESARN